MNNIDIKIKLLKESYISSYVAFAMFAGTLVIGLFTSFTFLIASVFMFAFFAMVTYNTIRINKEIETIRVNAYSNREIAIATINKLIFEYTQKQVRNEEKMNANSKDSNDSFKDALRYKMKIKKLLEIKDELDGDSFE